ncbi:MAG: RelA/SpoT family protein [Rikenellaceae bacterium]|nr:RelA/SpoT family protein [Rikenellaceae bacterium]MCL2692426.1 RelA/SpoT family protein [Rikenellaceae bacterium]
MHTEKTIHKDRPFRELVEEYFHEESVAMIDEALGIAEEKLKGLMRYDGSPLVGHSIGVASIVISEIGLGRNSTISALMHDVVQHGMMTAEEVGERFGPECTLILKALCNIADVRVKVSKGQTDNFRDLIVSYSTDPRVILIKLADRLEVMRSLAMFPPKKRSQKSLESLNLYAQIAHKLGLYSIKSELEDLSLRWLEEHDYQEISRKLEETAAEREEFIVRLLRPIEERLNEAGMKYHIKSRTKSVYSIWSKMRRTGLPFEEIYDIFALRIVVDVPRESEKTACWNVYSIVTDFYTPNPDRLRDWISIPKSNGYESLHTTVVTKDGKWIEIQIRSERMDAVAERGIAAHWRYKGVHQGGMGAEQWLVKLREIMEHQEDAADGSAHIGGSAEAAVIDEIFVFTPTGDLKKLREGSTLLDFAFEIHSDLGCTCTGGRINQRNASIRDVLRNGDIVEIHTSKLQKPKPDWLKVVKTSKARNRIRVFLRDEQAKQAGIGREELERRLRNWKLPITSEAAVTLLCRYFKIKKPLELYSRVAAEQIDVASLKELLNRHLDGEEIAPVGGARPRSAVGGASACQARENDSLVIDDSIRDLEYKLAKCCNPIRGDEVFGFVTVNSGITIHRCNCPNAARLREQYPYRVQAARWREGAVREGAFQATIRIVTDNIAGIINKVTEVIAQQMSVNIRSMSIAPGGRGELSGTINIEVTNTRIVDAVVYNILKIKGVQRAHRVNN